MTTRIEAATPEDIMAVALDMRERDLREISALLFVDDKEEIARGLVERYGKHPGVLTVFHDEKPVCIGALLETRPNVVSALFFATDGFPKVAVPLTRFIRRKLFPRLKADGVHRIEAVSLLDYEQMHRWLKVLGLRQETPPMAGFGKRGESFVQFAWSSYAGQAWA